MSLMRINPLRDLQEAQNMVRRAFEVVPRLFADTDQFFTGGNWVPPVDVHETQRELVFTFEMPGFDKDKVSISVEEGRLIVRGEKQAKQDDDIRYHRVERTCGKFYRTFLLPTSVDAGKIEAHLKDGLLTVTLPKREEAKARQIAVNVN